MRPDLTTSSNSTALACRASDKLLQHCQQFVQPPQAAQPDGGRDDIVGGLRHIDMVIGMDAVLAQSTAQDLGGPVGDDLIDIHVMTGAGAGLEGIHNKLVVPFPFNHLLRSLQDGLRPFGIQQAQVKVDFGSGALDRQPWTR